MRTGRILTIMVVVVITILFVGAPACQTPHLRLRPFTVKIDWVPSPEYYGFFYAKAQGYYKDAGLDVTIQNGAGAPSVAKELSASTIYAGTTTSDNLLRSMSDGASFTHAIPLLKFNPCVLAVRTDSGISDLIDVSGKKIGTNKDASVYLQFQHLLRMKGIPSDSFSEVPIGWGGADVFAQGDVNGFLAYTTNAVVDLDARPEPVPYRELMFGQYGLESYGTVLVLNVNASSRPENIGEQEFLAFIKGTLKGYDHGAKDLPGAVKAVRDAAPTLDPQKLRIAIEKIGWLNSTTRYDSQQIDQWVPNVDSEVRRRFLDLLILGLKEDSK